MAYEILDQMDAVSSVSVRIAHATYHDLESLIFTLSYSIYRRVHEDLRKEEHPAMTSEERCRFQSDFERYFGRVSVSDILDARRNMILRSDRPGGGTEPRGDLVYYHIDDSIAGLCQGLLTLLQYQYPGLVGRRIVFRQGLADPRNVKFTQGLRNLNISLNDQKPPPVYLSCARVKEVVNAFITVYFPDANC